MEFTASNEKIIPEKDIRIELNITINGLKDEEESEILPWEKEFLEWYLDRKIECKKERDYIVLHEDITQDELKQLEQLRDYLSL